jgi:hypothetical protein
MANPKGSSGSGVVFMVVGVVAVGGLLWWLSRAAMPSAPTTAEAAQLEEIAATDTTTVPIVDATDFARNPQRFEGREIDLGDVTVAQVMSPEIIWVELPGGMPFLVKLLPDAHRPAAQARVRVIGRVLVKSDSVLSAWLQSGALLDAGQRAQSEFGTNYLEARQVRPVGGQ